MINFDRGKLLNNAVYFLTFYNLNSKIMKRADFQPTKMTHQVAFRSKDARGKYISCQIKHVMYFLGIAFISLFLSLPVKGQHKIGIYMPEFAGDTLILGHYFRESMIIQDSAFLDQEGFGDFEGEKSLPPGLYLVYLPNKARFDLLIDKNQFFGISSDTSDLIRNTIIKGDPENIIFYQYQTFIADQREKAIELQKSLKSAAGKSDSTAINDKIGKINKQVFTYVDELVKASKGSWLSKFLYALKEVEVPDPPRDEKGNITDSTFQIRYFKNHYFDYFDLSDVRLLRTPFYEKKFFYYLDNLIVPAPDSVFHEVDRFINLARTDTFLFQYMLTTLFNYYASSKYLGMDAVYVYLAEKYYIPEASWSDRKFIEDLKKRVAKVKPLLVGQPAPDIQLVNVSDDHFLVAAEDTSLKKNPYVGEFFRISSINARYILLYFWESDCGHCKTTIPELFKMYQRLKPDGVRVVAVHMLSGIPGKEKWVDFVHSHELYGWINAWNPYDFSYREKYDVNSSNILYLLDKDKKIMAKHITPEQAEKMILNDMKLNKP